MELLNWKLEQMDRVAKKEKVLVDNDVLNDQEKQKVFEIMFKLDEASDDPPFDKPNSSANSASSAVTIEKQKIATRRTKINKLAATKHFMQNVLGKVVIPAGTVALILFYIIAVLAKCA